MERFTSQCTSLMGNQEAAELIEKIVSLYDEVAQLHGAEDQLGK